MQCRSPYKPCSLFPTHPVLFTVVVCNVYLPTNPVLFSMARCCVYVCMCVRALARCCGLEIEHTASSCVCVRTRAQCGGVDVWCGCVARCCGLVVWFRGNPYVHVSTHTHTRAQCMYIYIIHKSTAPRREVGGWVRDPKKCTGRNWGMGSSTI